MSPETDHSTKNIFKDDTINIADSNIILAGKYPTPLKTDVQSNPVMLQQIFERIVKLTPDYTAVIYETKEYSYQDLDRYANRIAHHLRSRGVQALDRVGILLKRPIETYAAIIAF